MWTEFRKIQASAGIRLECRDNHEHTDACQTYAFHDVRRGFATANAQFLPPLELQRMMRHTTFAVPQGYINMAQQSNGMTDRLVVPDVLKAAQS